MRAQTQKITHIPPKEFVLIYFSQKKMPEIIAEKFFDYYQSVNWKSSKGNPLNWKKEATNWIWKEQQRLRKLKKFFTSNPPVPSSKKLTI